MTEREKEATRDNFSSVKPRVLVVEDHEPIRRLVNAILAHEYDVVSAADGDAAKKLLDRKQRFHAVLSDISYPGGNADELLRHMAGHEYAPHQSVPLVLMTAGHGNVMADLVRQETARGRHVQTIEKPFSPQELLKLIAEAVRQSKQR